MPQSIAKALELKFGTVLICPRPLATAVRSTSAYLLKQEKRYETPQTRCPIIGIALTRLVVLFESNAKIFSRKAE